MSEKNVSVVGIGKLGLCFALTLEKSGFNVLGVDLSEEYVNLINAKKLKSSEENVENYLNNSKNFKATTSIEEALKFSNMIFVVVATPSLKNGKYNHKQVDALVKQIKKFGKQEETKHLVICCTTMPEYCDSVYESIKDYNYTVSYNPEFIAQGTILKNQEQPDMVLIGESSKEVGDLIEEIYKKHTTNNPKICRMNRTEAEICKISLNCFLTTKIAYTNMIGDIVKTTGGRPQTVLDAIASDTRVGQKLTKYGFGFGGPCFPRDNRALGIFAKEKNIKAHISDSTDKCNKEHLNFQVEQFLNSNIKEVVLDTVSYKPESTMLEESQQLAFALALAKNGIKVIIRERKEVIEEVKNRYNDIFTYIER